MSHVPVHGKSVRASVLVLCFSVVALLGCSTTLGFLNPPRRLLEQSRTAIEGKDFDTAYDRLVEIRMRYPESAESREAFRLAAAIWQASYFKYRYQDPRPHWVTSEPRFMMEWFASFFPTETFPEAEATVLFVGMHYGFFRDFQKFQQTRPELAAWHLRVQDDNGIVESLEVHRVPDGQEAAAGHD
jgi:hypothetical protein